jgi:hypothetical protein
VRRSSLPFPLVFLQMFWTEWIEIRHDSITWTVNGFFRPRPRSAPLSSVIELGLGHLSSEEATEPGISLNLFLKGGAFGTVKRWSLANWIAPDHKAVIFDGIERYVARHAIPIKLNGHADKEPKLVKDHS